MGRDNEARSLVCGQLAVGLSAVIGLTFIAGQMAPTVLRFISGGTCQLVGVGGTQVGTGFTNLVPALGPGQGYQFFSGDAALILQSSGTLFFTSAGATSIIGFVQHRSPDYT